MSSNTATKALGHLDGADQRNAPEPRNAKAQTNSTDADRFNEGKEGSHDLLDSKDQRSIANTLAAASKAEKQEKEEVVRPTDIARSHGNEPSKGAKIDEEIQREEEEYLKRKGKA